MLEECAADKTEPLRRGEHHKKIHRIQTTIQFLAILEVSLYFSSGRFMLVVYC